MGNTQLALSKKYSKLQQQFKLVYQTQDGTVKEYQNLITKDIVQFSVICDSQANTRLAQQSYQRRKLYSFIYTPSLYNYSVVQSTKGMGNQKKKFQQIQVFSQQAYQRLCNFKIRTKGDRQFLQQSLMKQALEGFQYLCHQYGSFRITKFQIGWTIRKICKVWINQNFALNYPNQKGSSQANMVQQIFDIFQGILGVTFKKQKIITFQDALKFYENLNFSQLQKKEDYFSNRRRNQQRHKTSNTQRCQLQKQFDGLMNSQPNNFGYSKKQFKNMNNGEKSTLNFTKSFKSLKAQRDQLKGCQNYNIQIRNEVSQKIPIFCNKTNRMLINPRASCDSSSYSSQNGNLTDRVYYQQKRNMINDSMKKVKLERDKIYPPQHTNSTEQQIASNQSSSLLSSYKQSQKNIKQNHKSQSKANHFAFILSTNNGIGVPYQTSSLKIGTIKSSLLTSQSFGGNKSSNLHLNKEKVLNGNDIIKEDPNSNDIEYHQRRINDICGGQSRVLTSQDLFNQEKYQNMKNHKAFKHDDAYNEMKLIQENQLQQQLDGLFLGDLEIEQDGLQQKQYFNQIRVQLAQLLNDEP